MQQLIVEVTKNARLDEQDDVVKVEAATSCEMCGSRADGIVRIELGDAQWALAKLLQSPGRKVRVYICWVALAQQVDN